MFASKTETKRKHLESNYGEFEYIIQVNIPKYFKYMGGYSITMVPASLARLFFPAEYLFRMVRMVKVGVANPIPFKGKQYTPWN